MPVLWGLFCYCILVFRGVVFCTCGLFFFFFFFFCFTPSRICDSAGISKSERVRNTDIVVITVRGQFMGPKALYIETCCFEKKLEKWL